ncbi:MAG: lipoprotein-releasing system ATP-binding protein LolD [Candidatus Zixiibacteriota bacterium]|nr:MAG: lipoprotein-releasing system ATP-binding protein LolD [candidate division Zixibacteria bacterium]
MNTENTNNILSATDLCREFKTAEGLLEVLKGVTLEVKRGQMAVIMGASGVGKSTLLHILGGLDNPTSGEVTIGQKPLSGMSEADRARFRNKRVGFVFQHHYLMDDFSALENVMIPMLLSGESRSQSARKAELLLDQVGLSSRASHRPDELSGGEQQRVAVARALANDPEVVLADEPSGNLDTETGRMLHDLLHRLNNEKQTSFVIATHNRELADNCNVEFRLVGGKLTGC